jgi:hypothetical protein
MTNTKQLIANLLSAIDDRNFDLVIDIAAELLADQDALKSAAAGNGMSAGDFYAATPAEKVEAAVWYDENEGGLPRAAYDAINAAHGA